MRKLFTLINRIRLELYEQPSLTLPNSYVIYSRVSPITHDGSTSVPRDQKFRKQKNTGKITSVISPVWCKFPYLVHFWSRGPEVVHHSNLLLVPIIHTYFRHFFPINNKRVILCQLL